MVLLADGTTLSRGATQRAKETGLLKQKDFKSYLNSRLKNTYARNQAKLFQNLGIKINKILDYKR